jgi:DNA-binding transcriptional LysR family regulator
MNSTEGILAAVEAGLGVGFVPCAALDKALKTGSVKAIPLLKGPIRRQLSIALLNGPEPKGPIGQLLEVLREYSPVIRQGVGNGLRELVGNKSTSTQKGKTTLRKEVP